MNAADLNKNMGRGFGSSFFAVRARDREPGGVLLGWQQMNTKEGGAVADWLAIKTEYITTDTSYRKLAEKYGVNYQTICARSKAEGWILLREQHRNNTFTKTVKKIGETQAKQAAKVSCLADKLLVKLEKAIDELDLKVTTHKVKVERGATETTTEFKVAEEGGTVDRAGLLQLTNALNKLQIIKGEITDLERREKEARIEALRRQNEKDDEDTGVIEVVFDAGPEEWNE